jgi:type IV secretion system protein VirD4
VPSVRAVHFLQFETLDDALPGSAGHFIRRQGKELKPTFRAYLVRVRNRPSRPSPQDLKWGCGVAGIILGWHLPSVERAMGFVAAGTTGPPVRPARNAEPIIADRSEAHALVVAPTGSGKGRNLILPNLLHWPHSAIVVDVKGEAALATARYRRSLGQHVVVLDPFGRVSDGADGLNPMDWLAGSHEHVADNATTLSETLTGTERSLKDPFWDSTANDLVAGLIALAATSDDPFKRNLGFVYDSLTADDVVYGIAVMLDTVKSIHPYAKRQLASFLNHESEKVRPSVISTAQQHLRVFASPLVQKAVSKTTLDLAALQRGEPLTIYLVMPATRLVSHAALLRIWLWVLLSCIAERRTQPLAPTLLVVDELAQIGGMPLILQALTLMRGFGLRVMPILQSLAQLRSLWPTDYQTILDNCGTIVAFNQSRPDMAEPMSKLFGDISADTLMRLPKDHLVINRSGEGTIVARKLDYLTDAMFASRFDPNPFYGRQEAEFQ